MHIVLPVSVPNSHCNNNSNTNNTSADKASIKFEVLAQVGTASDIIFEKNDVINKVMASAPVVKLTITNNNATAVHNTNEIIDVVMQSLIAKLKSIIANLFNEFENSIKFDPIHSGL